MSEAELLTEYKVVVIGPGGTGKSCLTNQFVTGFFTDGYDPTIEDSYTKKVNVDGEQGVMDILDTAGQEEYSAMLDEYMRHGQGFILVYSTTSEKTFQEVQAFKDKLFMVKDVKPGDWVPMVLVGNKIDLVDQRQVSTEQGQLMAKTFGCPFFEASAKTNQNVYDVYYQVVREIRKFRAVAGVEGSKKAAPGADYYERLSKKFSKWNVNIKEKLQSAKNAIKGFGRAVSGKFGGKNKGEDKEDKEAGISSPVSAASTSAARVSSPNLTPTNSSENMGMNTGMSAGGGGLQRAGSTTAINTAAMGLPRSSSTTAISYSPQQPATQVPTFGYGVSAADLGRPLQNNAAQAANGLGAERDELDDLASDLSRRPAQAAQPADEGQGSGATVDWEALEKQLADFGNLDSEIKTESFLQPKPAASPAAAPGRLPGSVGTPLAGAAPARAGPAPVRLPGAATPTSRFGQPQAGPPAGAATTPGRPVGMMGMGMPRGLGSPALQPAATPTPAATPAATPASPIAYTQPAASTRPPVTLPGRGAQVLPGGAVPALRPANPAAPAATPAPAAAPAPVRLPGATMGAASPVGSPAPARLPGATPARLPGAVSPVAAPAATPAATPARAPLAQPFQLQPVQPASKPAGISASAAAQYQSTLTMGMPQGDVLERYPWYKGNMSGGQADQALAGKPTGTFLIRNSSQAGYLAVSYVDQGEVQKALIAFDADKKNFWMALDENPVKYPTLGELVQSLAHMLKHPYTG